MTVSTISYTSSIGLLYFIEFDAVMTEVHLDTADITEHPIETGGVVSDYSRAKPTRVTVEGLVTNTPIYGKGTAKLKGIQIGELVGLSLPLVLKGAMNRQLSRAGLVGGFSSPISPPGSPTIFQAPTAKIATYTEIPNVVSGATLQFPIRVDRVTEVYTVLKDLLQSGAQVSFFSHLFDYEEMYISSLSAPREAQDAIRFSLELTEVRFANSTEVDVSVKKKKAPDPAEPRGQSTVPAQTGVPLSDDSAQQTGLAREAAQALANALQSG